VVNLSSVDDPPSGVEAEDSALAVPVRLDDVRTLPLVVSECVAEVASDLDILVATASIVLHVETGLQPSGPTTDEPLGTLEDLDTDAPHVVAHLSGWRVEVTVKLGVVDRQLRVAEPATHGMAAVM
jgi:hypothetical protein